MTREEAIKVAIEMYGWLKTDREREALETLIPELSESNDERIRKYLIEELKAAKSVGELKFIIPQPTREECITYLEKQKYDRMKPVYDNQDSFESALEKAWNDYHNGYENVDKLEDDYVECAHAKGFREGYLFGLEKQKEQHIPWYDYQKSKEAGYTIVPNEEYEQLIKQKEQKPALSEVELLFRGEKVTVKRPFYRDNKGRGYSTTEQDEETAWNALRAWCEKKGISLYDLYPKAEWSEEDAKMLDAMIDIVSGSFYEPLCPRKEMLTWLKSLRPQPKQEWSEEDEIHVRSIFGDFRQDVVPDEEDQDWLKKKLESLRPSWKPSEEQMEALKWLVEYVSPSEKYIVIVKNLYEQLKKL